MISQFELKMKISFDQMKIPCSADFSDQHIHQ